MRISKPEIIIENNQVIYRVNVESSDGKKLLWYSLEKQHANLLTDFCDAPIVALLIPAMARGEDIYVEGMLSEKLYYNLSSRAQQLLRNLSPSLRQIKIHPSGVGSDICEASGVLTGFSGGIDSYCTLADHYFSEITGAYKISYLLFNNVGSHGVGGEGLFNARYNNLKSTADQIGLPFLKINSNVSSFYGGKSYIRIQQTHTLRNVSVALLLQKGIRCYMYASAYSYPETFVGPSDSIGYIDPILLPLLSTEILDAFSVGGEYTRVEKTLKVNNIHESYRTLDVCIDPNYPGKNCSTCWKCMRTLLTMDIGGFINNYSFSFNLDSYQNERKKYIRELLNNKDPFSREIVQFAKERNYLLQ